METLSVLFTGLCSASTCSMLWTKIPPAKYSIELWVWSKYVQGNYIMLTVYYTPRTTKLLGGYIGFTPSVRPASVPVRPASRVCSVASTFLVGSISYLYILSNNFRRCVACKVSCKISKSFGNFLKICNFDFVLFWLGIWCESLVWVIMGRRRVSQNAGVLVVLVSAGCM